MWLSNKEIQRKIAGIHNVDVAIALATQMEAITRKFNALTHSINMVQTRALVCTS